jgi:predicted lipoprotein with Yx(FWY)xxD motif
MLLAACGGGSSNRSSTATQPAPTAQPAAVPAKANSAPSAATPSGPIVITVSTAKYGPILADAKGLALYWATGDTTSRTGCTGACLKYWPPLLLPAGEMQPIAGTGVSGLGTFVRAEGTQVTYHGKQLYTWIGDSRPGQVTGQGVVDSGGTWYVATVAAASTKPAAATPSTAAPPMTQAPVTPASTPSTAARPMTHAPVTPASTPSTAAPPMTHAPVTPASTPPTTAPGGGVSY